MGRRKIEIEFIREDRSRATVRRHHLTILPRLMSKDLCKEEIGTVQEGSRIGNLDGSTGCSGGILTARQALHVFERAMLRYL